MEIGLSAGMLHGPVRAAAAGVFKYQRRADAQTRRLRAGYGSDKRKKVLRALYVELLWLKILRLLPGR